MLSGIEAFVFDLDGTLYLGDRPLPGALETVSVLRRRSSRILYISNNPTHTRQAYAQKLSAMGFPAEPEDIITSGYVLGFYLSEHEPDLKLYVIGEETFRQELRGFGLNVVEETPQQDPFSAIDPAGINAVVVAFDRTLDYRKLNIAYQALRGGARFFATNPDRTCPVPGGEIPDAGATLAALSQITGRKVELIAGKPSPLMAHVLLSRLDLPPHRCLLTGDRLDTDIRLGQQAGMHTCLVLTGATKPVDLAGWSQRPSWVIRSMREFLHLS